MPAAAAAKEKKKAPKHDTAKYNQTAKGASKKKQAVQGADGFDAQEEKLSPEQAGAKKKTQA